MAVDQGPAFGISSTDVHTGAWGSRMAPNLAPRNGALQGKQPGTALMLAAIGCRHWTSRLQRRHAKLGSDAVPRANHARDEARRVRRGSVVITNPARTRWEAQHRLRRGSEDWIIRCTGPLSGHCVHVPPTRNTLELMIAALDELQT